ncbi:GATA transcription factor 21 [Dorcoceras hygrometricum]|uniref:GATA transcription factor 21 n=1 Tax=Dorcoceras hygrometricum TaxID=472368 RepID=A0A2Z7AIM4_9LAMI|nr:GATA transcription factor 21 [Dorcoceras hygrometricum]
MNLNISPSTLELEQISEDQDHNPQFSCRVFFDSSTGGDRTRFYNHHQCYQPHHHHPEDDYSSYHGGSPYEDDIGLKLTLWNDPMEWKPSRVEPTKMDTEEDRVIIKISTSARNKIREEQKLQPSSSLETDLSSNSCCNIVTTTPTIRVCSDCNTTKTPLWRSGPKGPKSLCNACGIRQRKARRAMAAAAAADPPPRVSEIKVQQQNKQKISKTGHGQDSKFKKRSKMTASSDGSSSSLEDFLIKLSKNLSFHRVFPQDEKDAAILLMALSSGLVHG